ncbi:hypothetical protein FACS1894211_07650 [Clostridia bacterium]|nr:hypothetical protein FACS1894211_07650 [Clostridia bacterium]
MSEKSKSDSIRSFMISDPKSGERFGDLVSGTCKDSGALKIGLVHTGYFEYWLQYPELKEIVLRDVRHLSGELAQRHDIVDAGLVDTADGAIEAGRLLKTAGIDLLVLAYRTYLPDSFMHGLLDLLPGIPLVFLATQTHDTAPKGLDYCQILRNSGYMSEIQIVASFKKIGIYDRLEVVAGNIYDSGFYTRLDAVLDVLALRRKLKFMTVGTIGNVFRGMFDFEFDRTKVKGGIGPEVIGISLSLLEQEFHAVEPGDKRLKELTAFVKSAYRVSGVGDGDIGKACRLAVALERICKRFSLDGIALLGQHFVEKTFGTQPFLAINELQRADKCVGVTEGDVLGVIMMAIMKNLTGHSAWQFEYSEFDVGRNAIVLLGHGHCDPRESAETLELTPACEHWGHEGAGVSFEGMPKPGVCTLAHFIEDKNGWRMFICVGEVLPTEPLKINEIHAYVKVNTPILTFVEEIVKAGLPHHICLVRGDCSDRLKKLAEQLGMPWMTV